MSRVPWWVLLVLGLGCVVVGVALLAEPFRSLTTLVWLITLGLLLSGVSELLSVGTSPRPWLSRLTGVAWIVCAVVSFAWPDITIWPLAVTVGVALVVGGIAKLIAALFGDGEERLLLGVGGATNIVVGLLSLTWPALTVLALAVLFGIRMILFGISQIALAFKTRQAPADDSDGGQRRWPRSIRLIGAVIGFVLALGGAAVSVALQRAQPNEPGAFYTPPMPLPDGPPGTLIRREVIEDYYPDSTTYRVLYLSTDHDGRPEAVSGIVIVPDVAAPPGGRKVLAYTHGTVGVAPRCAPSLQDAAHSPLDLEGGEDFLRAGYVIAASDYEGLGTPGPHPYLVGAVEAMNTLDGVRAARNISEAGASDEFAVWGHSQGGHASLFTGQLAGDYAPELRLVGVAAGGPVPDLMRLFEVNLDTAAGKMLIAMALDSWSKVYDADLDQIVTPAARPAITRIAGNCLYGSLQLLGSVPSALALSLTFVDDPPWEVEPWKTIVDENNPGRTPVGAPLLIVQSDSDGIVAPEVTRDLVEIMCARGETVELLVLKGATHLETGSEAVPEVVKWIADRFDGAQPPDNC